MFVQSNLLIDLIPYFKEKLTDQYSEREIENIFYLVVEEKYQLKRFGLRERQVRLSESELLNFRSIVKRLAVGEPIQYILGIAYFYELKIMVDTSVLIPRPETEELVALILQENKQAARVLDIGTGSGCISIALKKNQPDFSITAIDISTSALSLANKSAFDNEVEIAFIEQDVFSEQLVDLGKFDIIVSNPPYVLEADKLEMEKNVLEFEPHLALFVEDAEPLKYYLRIIEAGKKMLKPKGKLYFEIHEKFGNEIKEALQSEGYQSIQIFKDLQGKDRMVRAIYE
jgi:release factor glutamine methyltransferase